MIEHYRQEYTRSEQNLIVPYLRKLDAVANAMVFGQGLIEIYKGTGKLNLQEIERLLRQEMCRTYLIGLQVAGTEISTQFDVKLPGTDHEFPHQLWTEVNWEQAALVKLGEEGIDIQQNFERLADTGFLVPKTGTQLSRFLKADLN